MDEWFLRINGRGNAWPVPLGQENPFYCHDGEIEYANASFSLIRFKKNIKDKEHLETELMIDAGHGSIPNLLRTYNRIPDALFITHPHFDHILGIDWIAQSYYRFKNKRKYPLYATEYCWNTILETIPHLEEIIAFHPLRPGVTTEIHEADQVFVTTFPVFHGASAKGAAMFLFEVGREKHSKVLFSGDVLFPLLNEQAYEKLQNVDYCLVDSNNRFPYPQSNHWSMTAGNKDGSESLNIFMNNLDLENVLESQAGFSSKNNYSEYFQYFKYLSDWKKDIPFTVFDFIERIHPKIAIPVHYSGLEDEKYYNKTILNSVEMQNWLNNSVLQFSLSTTFVIAEIGDFFSV
jgi:phosphoribosyl 1,2-cyclic phosphodiesterase